MVLGEYDVALLSDLTTERVSVLLRNVMLLDVVFLIDMLLSWFQVAGVCPVNCQG